MSKEYSVRKISKKITCKVDRTIYGNNTNEINKMVQLQENF